MAVELAEADLGNGLAAIAAGLDPVDSPQAIDLIKKLETSGRRLDAARVELVDVIDRKGLHRADGHHSAKIMVRHVAKLSGAEAAARARTARAGICPRPGRRSGPGRSGPVRSVAWPEPMPTRGSGIGSPSSNPNSCPSPRLARLAAQLANTECFWPGCHVPVSRCQIDHLVPFTERDDGGGGGRTNPGNGGPACGKHNRHKEHGSTVWRDPTGRWHTHRPDGTEIEERPRSNRRCPGWDSNPHALSDRGF